jgi:uncharacterized membrane protein YeaQ/YmgE (transglycosylase-associated protein family)
MGLLWTAIVGLLAGALAKAMSSDTNRGGLRAPLLLGVSGALAGGFVGQSLGWYGAGDKAALGSAILGAMVALLLQRHLSGMRFRI